MGWLFGKTVSLKLSTRLHKSVRQVDCRLYRMLQHSKVALTNQDTSCLRSGQQEAVSAVAFGQAKIPFNTWLRTCRLITNTNRLWQTFLLKALGYCVFRARGKLILISVHKQR